jgi:hypothetical protein
MFDKPSAIAAHLQTLQESEILVWYWTAKDVIESVVTSDGETYLTEQQALTILRTLNRNACTPDDAYIENVAVSLFGAIPCSTHICSICGETRRSDTMHLHQGDWIGHDCCWDDRLHASE